LVLLVAHLAEVPIGYHLAAGPVEGARRPRNETAPGGIERTPTIHVQLSQRPLDRLPRSHPRRRLRRRLRRPGIREGREEGRRRARLDARSLLREGLRLRDRRAACLRARRRGARAASGGPMTCRELDDFLGDYVAGELDAQVRAVFDAHLAACPECVTYL